MGNSHQSVTVVAGADAPELERFAAGELCRYLRQLFGIETNPTSDIPASADCVFILGSPETNPAVKAAAARHPFPQVSDQGIVLRALRLPEGPALLVGGGSPRATLWAVYELVERLGARYLLHGDVLPAPRPFEIPNFDDVTEPVFTVRECGALDDFAISPCAWSMAEYGAIIDQFAKLKFNRIFLLAWPWQPFLYFEYAGIRRNSAWLWYDYHYPITPDMIGRHLFGDAEEFWNPDLPYKSSYDTFASAGERYVHNLMEHAHRRGMECVLVSLPTEFPPEFAPLLQDPQKVEQIGHLTVVPGADSDLSDPTLMGLVTSVIHATVDTYPEADYLCLLAPEFRQWAGQYERAWQALDARYGIEKIRPLAEALAAAERRTSYAGGAKRAVQEVKGDIVALHFYDRLITDCSVLENTRRPEMPWIFCGIAEELLPVLHAILPRGSQARNIMDYTASRILHRREVFDRIPGSDLTNTLMYTIEDDNIGVLPQVMTGSLHELNSELRRRGWSGFNLRHQYMGDHDPCLAYLSKAAWDPDVTPVAAYRDLIHAVCGEACMDDMLEALREVEAVTRLLEWHAMGIGFPAPGMILEQWREEPMPNEWAEARLGYLRALVAMLRARPKALPGGRSYIDYWVGRLEFAAGYLETIQTVRCAAAAEARNESAETLRYTERALLLAIQAIEAYARVARDQSDRGAIAVLNEYVYRPLKGKVSALTDMSCA